MPCVELLIVWIEIFKNKEESLLPFGRNYFLWHISCIQYKIFGFPLITARKRSLQKGNVFTYVCHSVHEGGVCHTPLGRHPPADIPLHSVCGIQSPPFPVHAGIHPLPNACWDTLPQCMLGYGQQAGSTHPTGMLSCLLLRLVMFIVTAVDV